MTTKQTQKELV